MINLKQFESKICTLITVHTNRNFKEEASAMGRPDLYPVNLLDHFMGRIVQIDGVGILLEHPLIKTKAYFRLEHIIGVIEEQELDKNDPQNVKIIEEIKNKNNPPPRGKVNCPNGHGLNIPSDIPDGSEVVCPACKIEFILNEKPVPKNDSELVDLDILSRLAQEANLLK